MPKRKVGEGEGTSSLAKKNGFYWKTIWEHGENAGLRAKRKDPNVLSADDEIFIPEKVEKKVSKGNESEHVFKRKGEPTQIKMQMLALGEPRANEDYILEVGGQLIKGTTDGEGKIQHFIPGDTKSGKLHFKDGKEIHPLRMGSLDPTDEATGVMQRLNNLGYKAPASLKRGIKAKDAFEESKIGKKAIRALRNFQAENGLEETGKADGATIAKLEELAK